MACPPRGAGATEKYHLGAEESLPPEKPRKKKPPSEEMTPEERKALVDEVAEDFYNKGVKAMNEGRYNQAEAFFDRALILDPHHQGARDGTERLMKMMEGPEAESDPDKTDSKAALVKRMGTELDQRIKEGDWEEANTVATKILAIDPENARAKGKRAGINQQFYLKAKGRAEERERAGDWDAALDAYKVAAGYRPTPAVRDKINSLREKIAERNKKKSGELYLQALKANQEGKGKSALQLCKQALELDPQNLQARRMLDRLAPR